MNFDWWLSFRKVKLNSTKTIFCTQYYFDAITLELSVLGLRLNLSKTKFYAYLNYE